MAQTTWNVNLRRAEVLNMSWSGAAVIAGELLDKHGYQYTFCIAAGLCAVALVVFSPLLLLKLQRLPSGPVEVLPNAKAHNAPKFERFESGAAEVVVVVDPFSTGGFLAAELLSQGCAVIALWTKECNIRYHDARIALSITKHFVDAPSWLAKDCETSSNNGKAVKHVWDLELTWIIHFSQYFTLTRCIHAGFGAIFPCFSLFSLGLSEDFRSQTTLGRAGRRANRGSHSSSTSRGVAFALGRVCRVWDHAVAVAISWWSTFFDVLDPGCESAPVESALENNSCFGFPISRILVLSNPDTKLVLIR